MIFEIIAKRSLVRSLVRSLPSAILKIGHYNTDYNTMGKPMRRGVTMKRNIQKWGLTLGQLDSRHVRLGLVVLSLVLFVLGAGAPMAGTGHG